jgi:aldose 1-epimerase
MTHVDMKDDSTGREGQCDVSVAPFGMLPDGRQAMLFTLVNGNGMEVRLTDFGGIVTHLFVPDRHGNRGDVVLGYDSLEPYLQASPYFGALIGRYGNRIARGRFTLDGQTYQLSVNDGENHLHGGEAGFDKRRWNSDVFRTAHSAGVTLARRSADGEQGYPGNVDVVVSYELCATNELVISYHAVTDRATPVNLTHHGYFNLAGDGETGADILGHELMIDADAYTPVDAGLIPDGTLASVAGTPFDFRAPRPIGACIDEHDEQLACGKGYDHNFVLTHDAASGVRPAVRVRDPHSGRVLELFSTEPGMQFYSGNFLDGSLGGKGRRFGHRSGFCIEPQHFPDSPNQPAFPNTILRPGEQYRSVSRYVFSVAP